MKIRIKIPDICIIFLALTLIFFSVYSVYVKPQDITRVLIRGQDSEWSFPMHVSETVIVPGMLGNTVVMIENNRARIESSPCINQNCVTSGFVSRQGQWAACLPNNVLLMIEGTDDNGIDAISR